MKTNQESEPKTDGPTKWRDMGWPQRLRLIAFSLIPVVILLIVAQTFAYLTIHRTVTYESDPVTGKPALYRMTFGGGLLKRVTETPLNSLGFPDREFADIGPKGDCTHIVFAGDSFVFGDAVNRHRNFFSLVQRSVARAHPDRCIRMFNIAERETTIQQQASRIRETRELLDPDLVILGQYQNDLPDLTIRSDESEAPAEEEGASWWTVRIWNRIPLANSSLVRFLTYRAFAILVTGDIHYDMLAQWSVIADPGSADLAERLMSTYREIYTDLVDELRADGVEIGTVIIPSKIDLMAGEYPEEAFFVELSETTGTPYLTVLDALDENRADYPYQMYDGHLSEAGNEVVAAEIFQWLLGTDGTRPFPTLVGAAARSDSR